MAENAYAHDFHCVTANLSGNSKARITDAKGNRYKLSKELFESNDILFLQEVTFDELIKENYGSTRHHIHMGTIQTPRGILLSQASFDVGHPPRTELATDAVARVNRLYEDWNIRLDITRMQCVVSTYRATNARFLCVSYHGHQNDENLIPLNVIGKTKRCIMMMKFCDIVREEEEAEYLMIGGDFNVSIAEFRENVLPEFEEDGRMKYKAVGPSWKEVRSGNRLDFFVCDNNLQMNDASPIPYDDEKVPDGYKLCAYFDHDPVVAVCQIPRQEQGQEDSQQSSSGTSGNCTEAEGNDVANRVTSLQINNE